MVKNSDRMGGQSGNSPTSGKGSDAEHVKHKVHKEEAPKKKDNNKPVEQALSSSAETSSSGSSGTPHHGRKH
jgi:hypothetical protein